MRRKVGWGLCVLCVMALGTMPALHVLSEGFRANVSWRLSRPYYAWELRDAAPWEQERLLSILGRRAHPVYRGLLLRYAEEAPDMRVRLAAQLMLSQHYPDSWPATAHAQYVALAGYDLQETDLPVRYWGEQAWVRSAEAMRPPRSPARAWQRYVDRYPRYVSADDAAFELARARHFEGDARGVVEALETGMSLGDGDFHRHLDAALRHYLIEQATEAELDRWLEDPGELRPETVYYIRYAKGLRQLWRLEVRAALRTFEAIQPAGPREVPRWLRGSSRIAELKLARPSRRIAVLTRLSPFEADWRSAASPSGKRLAAQRFREALAEEDRLLGPELGLFEPWILVDHNLHHPMERYLEALR